ncbi:hypothetical protein AN643_02705 [Candidatus Epulonipiscioides saccharophilum]|nr:hypothetical protein AN643_02705 [Epulopiscium sp. SCG-B10WGA-EpuloB]
MNRLNPMPLIRGIFLSLLTFGFAVLIAVPEAREWFILNKDVLIHNLILGLCALPVFMAVVLKSANNWHKKFSSWFTIIFSCLAIIGVVLYSAYGGPTDDSSEFDSNPDFLESHDENYIL